MWKSALCDIPTGEQLHVAPLGLLVQCFKIRKTHLSQGLCGNSLWHPNTCTTDRLLQMKRTTDSEWHYWGSQPFLAATEHPYVKITTNKEKVHLSSNEFYSRNECSLFLLKNMFCKSLYFHYMWFTTVYVRTNVQEEQNDKDEPNIWIPEQTSTLHLNSLQDSKCLSVFEQIAFVERRGGFLPPGNTGIGEWTGGLSHWSCSSSPVWED